MSQESIFPNIQSIEDLEPFLLEKDEIKFMLQSNGTTVCSYVVSMDGTFDTKEAREARGIVFDAEGLVIARPLHKFFNLNQEPHVRADVLDWSKAVRVMDKRDGSMIHTVKAVQIGQPGFFPPITGDGYSNFVLKSKKSFTSDVALDASKWMMENTTEDNQYIGFCNTMTDMGLTAIFEWTAPTARIVLAYDKPMLTLLHVRNNRTGEYWNKMKLELASIEYGIPVVADAPNIDPSMLVSESYLRDIVENTEGIEGWVIQFENGDMVKVKTKWYVDRHRAMTFLRERDIALMVLEESLDDLKALLVGEGANIDDIIRIEHDVVGMIQMMVHTVEFVYAAGKDLDRKSFAMKYGKDGQDHKYFGLLMQRYSGKEPDYKGYFKRNILPERYTLKQLNLVQSVAEAE